MKSNYKRLGDYIKEVNNRNTNLEDVKLLGVSIQKVFIPSIANTIGTDMSTYKLITKKQFAYGPVTSRNGDKISVALLNDYEKAMISQAYTSFEVIDENELLPEYLMMWFRRSEFDRYARFMSHGSAREIFGWEEMCNTILPVPTITKQKEIVKEYNVLVDRINLNNRLIQKLEETAQTIYKQWFVDFEFPDENGKPYKSNGGEMEISKKLDKEVPKGWKVDSLKNITSTIDNRGKTPPHREKETNFPLIEIGSIRSTDRIIDYDKCEKYIDEDVYNNWFRSGHPTKKDVLFSTVGSLAEMKIFWGTKGSIAQNIVAFRCKENIGLYIYQLLLNSKNDLVSYEIGSVQASIKVSHIVDFNLLLPDKELTNKYEKYAEAITENIFLLCEQNLVLKKLIHILLQRMTQT
ncbi:restriction endonuclease subunit S [Virgibacillus sp. LDC1]|nr:restriction endonuclease subunit S [Virgibacillus sp. LDC1]